eukprot:c482_g1_i1 orf=64-219(+)
MLLTYINHLKGRLHSGCFHHVNDCVVLSKEITARVPKTIPKHSKHHLVNQS